MKSKEFIKFKLNELVEVLPTAKLSYQFKDSSQTHFIKIEPAKLYDDDQFIHFYASMLMDFDNLFENEGVCFLNDDVIDLHNIEFIVKGCKYTS